MTNFSSMAAFLWSVADLLRGDFKQSQYGRVILPFTVLRRLECVLEPTKQAVLDKTVSVEKMDNNAAEKILCHAANQHFYNTSPLDLSKIRRKPSPNARVSQKAGIDNKPTEIYCLLLGLTTHDRLKITHNIRATALDKLYAMACKVNSTLTADKPLRRKRANPGIPRKAENTGSTMTFR